MRSGTRDIARYLPTDRQARRWGWRLLDAGRQTAPPDALYPGFGHPQHYLFDRAGYRTLDEFQIVFIESGRGVFESRDQPRTALFPGQAFLLFPGVWHRYRPLAESGWTEYWAGFRGREAERIMGEFFHPTAPVINVAWTGPLLAQFHRILDWLREDLPGREQVLASHLPMLLAFLRGDGSKRQNASGPDGRSALVARAKRRMLENLDRRTDLKALSAQLGMSYSAFRSVFKKQTGYPPRAFENRTKLNRARDLLRFERCTVSQTADRLGYASIFYFSRAFKKQFGHPPVDCLGQRRPEPPPGQPRHRPNRD
mgnify:CR=1 FL=1